MASIILFPNLRIGKTEQVFFDTVLMLPVGFIIVANAITLLTAGLILERKARAVLAGRR